MKKWENTILIRLHMWKESSVRWFELENVSLDSRQHFIQISNRSIVLAASSIYGFICILKWRIAFFLLVYTFAHFFTLYIAMLKMKAINWNIHCVLYSFCKMTIILKKCFLRQSFNKRSFLHIEFSRTPWNFKYFHRHAQDFIYRVGVSWDNFWYEKQRQKENISKGA